MLSKPWVGEDDPLLLETSRTFTGQVTGRPVWKVLSGGLGQPAVAGRGGTVLYLEGVGISEQ